MGAHGLQPEVEFSNFPALQISNAVSRNYLQDAKAYGSCFIPKHICFSDNGVQINPRMKKTTLKWLGVKHSYKKTFNKIPGQCPCLIKILTDFLPVVTSWWFGLYRLIISSSLRSVSVEVMISSPDLVLINGAGLNPDQPILCV